MTICVCDLGETNDAQLRNSKVVLKFEVRDEMKSKQ